MLLVVQARGVPSTVLQFTIAKNAIGGASKRSSFNSIAVYNCQECYWWCKQEEFLQQYCSLQLPRMLLVVQVRGVPSTVLQFTIAKNAIGGASKRSSFNSIAVYNCQECYWWCK